MKKMLIAGVVVGLVAGSMIPAQAAKKKKPKPAPAPVAVDMKYYLHDTSCEADDNYLSLTDGPDFHCWYYDTGVYDAAQATGLYDPDVFKQSYVTSSEGLPLTLDATKPVTGEITTRGLNCVDTNCAPVHNSAGQAAVDVTLRAEIDGEVTDLGTFAETFTMTPSEAHTSTIEIDIPDELDKKVATTLTVLVYLHGRQVGMGTVELDDPASFVSVPAFR